MLRTDILSLHTTGPISEEFWVENILIFFIILTRVESLLSVSCCLPLPPRPKLRSALVLVWPGREVPPLVG